LDPIYEYCRNEDIAPLSAIVVQQGTEIPGDGFIKGWGADYRQAFAEVFAFDWNHVPNPFQGYGSGDSTESLAATLIDKPERRKEIYAKVQVRGQIQTIFREALRKAYQNKCAVCGCTISQLLQAAHIIPWSRATEEQRVDPQNGILLCANHHRLFDTGVLTVTVSYTVHINASHTDKLQPREADSRLTVERHGLSLLLPSNRALRPLGDYLKDHHAAHEFTELLPGMGDPNVT